MTGSAGRSLTGRVTSVIARIRFNRNELSGSFGDIGTDLPLIMGMILTVNLDSASVFILFGLMQIVTGAVYGLPMPVQPLKAMAVLVITQKIGGDVLAGAGLAIGVVMLILSLTGGLFWIEHLIPKCVVRGIQFGLGLSLATLALKQYLPTMGWTGYGLALCAFAIVAALWNNHRLPPGAVVVLFGGIFAAVFSVDFGVISSAAGLTLPTWHRPAWNDIVTGFVVLSLPQLPLSLTNSVIATSQTLRDLFPERKVGIGRIGTTYGLMNIAVPFLGGIPVCHGCGGLAGHYAFGARTGGSVIIYGTIYVVLGLVFSGAVAHLVQVFPMPVLAVILFVEALTLMLLLRDQMASRRDTGIALMVGLIALSVPHGFIVGLLAGCALYYSSARVRFLSNGESS